MTDFPAPTIPFPAGACIHTGHPAVATSGLAEAQATNYVAAAWPVANLGIYIPFVIGQTKTAKQMFWENGAVAGTTDIGIYDSNKVLLVNLTATTNTGTIQIGNITDTILVPGMYYMGMVASTVTTQTYWADVTTVAAMRCAGVQEQAIGSATLPATATFAVYTRTFFPFMGISFQATM